MTFKLSERFWWKGMYDDVLKLVNKCLQCQQQNVVKMWRGSFELHPALVPNRCFAQWEMELVGPLKPTDSDMEHIIVLRCTFTPLPTRSQLVVVADLKKGLKTPNPSLLKQLNNCFHGVYDEVRGSQTILNKSALRVSSLLMNASYRDMAAQKLSSRFRAGNM